MDWIDFVIVAVVGMSIWSGYRSGAIRSTVSTAGLIIGIEFASRNYQRFARELAPMVHSAEAANAIWFVLQIFIVMLAFGFVGNAIQNELAWMESSFVDSLLGSVVSLARGIGLACVCIMTVAVFYPGSETLPNAYLPRYLDGVTAVIAELTTNGLHSKIVLGLTPTEPNGRDGENPSS